MKVLSYFSLNMIDYPFLRRTAEFLWDALSQTALLTPHQGIFHQLLNEAPRWHCTTHERSDTASKSTPPPSSKVAAASGMELANVVQQRCISVQMRSTAESTDAGANMDCNRLTLMKDKELYTCQR